MKVVLITSETQTIEQADIKGHADIAGLIGFGTLKSDEIGPEGDRLYYDEECFLRGIKGRFQIDRFIPVAGKAVIVGSGDGGMTLRDAVSDVEGVKRRLKYL